MLLRSLLLFSVSLFSADTALDRYVRTPDPAYQWAFDSSQRISGTTISLLNLTSQTWRTAAEVDKPEWKHWVQVYKPDALKTSSTALLFISGGNNSGAKPRVEGLLLNVAKEAGLPVIELRTIPSEPLRFAGETKSRSEDGIIAYTWRKFLDGGDDNWPLRLPMTKASVRAMDTATEFLASEKGGGMKINSWIVAGASKRGWTTWTTAAVDKRVIGIAPMVIDLLNIVPSFMHHFRAYGFWAPAIQDYIDERIPADFESKRYKELMRMVEPFEYRDRLTMPKLILNSAGDDFFLPDSSQFYYPKLKGEKHLRYVPNTRHNLDSPDVPQSLAAFAESLITNRPRPNFTWKVSNQDGAISLAAPQAPKEVKLWQITNPKTRDFRLTTTGKNWQSTPVTLVNGKYTARVPKPANGWTAFFLELTYDSGGKLPHKFTTEVSVVPRVYPYPKPKPGDGLPTTKAAR
ncbi:MAG: PhoPQ-activated pathogenicity-related family protein [Bryobacter sp.]|nr:PhoPQ-activated pathogenicity-related family protein [Bryobacter sp.]